MADAVVPAPLENVDETDEIRVDVGMGVLQRVPDPGLRGEVDDRIGPFAREELRHRRAVRDAGPCIAETGERRDAIEPRLLEGDVVVRIEIVDADDLVAAFEQAKRDGGADEAGRSGDKNLHGLGSVFGQASYPALSPLRAARCQADSAHRIGRDMVNPPVSRASRNVVRSRPFSIRHSRPPRIPRLPAITCLVR